MVRITLIGLGDRGMKTLRRYGDIAGAAIVGIADLRAERLECANKILAESGRPKARTYSGTEGWLEACADDATDLIYICTEWTSHCKIAVHAMQCGKHVAVEVPAATTVEECHLLVKTAESTGRQLFMTENCCYDHFSLAALEMHRQGFFGNLTHLEGAYIHNLREHYGSDTDRLHWMKQHYADCKGNAYPTHAIGPIAQLLGLREGKDRMESLTSVSGESGINHTLIRTAKGVSILLHLDVSTMRPYSRIQTICGTKGFSQKYPLPTICGEGLPEMLTGDTALHFAEKFMTGPAAQLWKEGKAKGVSNEMNYAMDSRLIHCIENNLPLDIDVYDAAAWSCLVELTTRSAENGGMPVEIPHFAP